MKKADGNGGGNVYRTVARQALSDFFASHPDRHYTAEQICRIFGGRQGDCSDGNPSGDAVTDSAQETVRQRSTERQRSTVLPRSTVYRQLARLCEEGVLRRFEETDPVTGAGVHMYQASVDAGGSDCGHHFHLKCLACGRVIHLGCTMSERLLDHIAAVHGFSVDCGSSILYGLCDACAPGRLPCSRQPSGGQDDGKHPIQTIQTGAK